MKWQRYTTLEKVKHMRNEGREFLGNIVSVTEKRDGQNISIWLDTTPETDIERDNVEIKVSSHNMEKCDDHLTSRFEAKFVLGPGSHP